MYYYFTRTIPVKKHIFVFVFEILSGHKKQMSKILENNKKLNSASLHYNFSSQCHIHMKIKSKFQNQNQVLLWL